MSYKNVDTCLKKAADDEPIFVLRAQDKFAPAIVRHWACVAGANGVSKSKVNEAFSLATLMEEWQENNNSKVPD